MHSMDTTLGVASMRTSSHCSDIMKGRKKEKNCDCPPPPFPFVDGRVGIPNSVTKDGPYV